MGEIDLYLILKPLLTIPNARPHWDDSVSQRVELLDLQRKSKRCES